MSTFLAVVAGGGLLIVASERFVEGAADLAFRLKVSAVVTGVLVMGFGTSAPEILVSSLAAARGSRDIGIGNLVGSNLANLALVLGVLGLMMWRGGRLGRRESAVLLVVYVAVIPLVGRS